MKLSIRLSRSLIISALLFSIISCQSGDQDSGTMLKVHNLSGYNAINVEVNLIFGGKSVVLEYNNLKDGEESDYQLIPADSLHEDGHYCTFTQAEVESLPFKIPFAGICTGLNDDRAELIREGKYRLIMEYIPAEFLDLSLYTHESNTNNDDVLINIKNKSEHDFLSVKATFPSDGTIERREIDYGTIQSGESSEFESVELAYRYASLFVVTTSDTLQFKPTDYVGETELEPGRYSYEIDILNGQKDVSRIVRD